MSSIPTKHIDGDVSVGRNVAIGGKAIVRGSAIVGHNLKVEGWLDAKNIKGANKGLFKTIEKLKEAFPNPQEGWCALIGDSLPAHLYMVEDGAWVGQTDTDGSPILSGNPTIDSEAQREAIDELTEAVEDLQTSNQNLSDTQTTQGELIVAIQRVASEALARVGAVAIDALDFDEATLLDYCSGSSSLPSVFKVTKDGDGDDKERTLGTLFVFVTTGGTRLTQILVSNTIINDAGKLQTRMYSDHTTVFGRVWRSGSHPADTKGWDPWKPVWDHELLKKVADLDKGKVPLKSETTTRIESDEKVQIQAGDDAEITGADVKIGARGAGSQTGKIFITNKVPEEGGFKTPSEEEAVIVESGTTAKVVSDGKLTIESRNDDVQVKGQDVDIKASGAEPATGHVVITNDEVSASERESASFLMKALVNMRLIAKKWLRLSGSNVTIESESSTSSLGLISKGKVEINAKEAAMIRSGYKATIDAPRFDVDLRNNNSDGGYDRAIYAKQTENGPEVKLRASDKQAITVAPVDGEGNGGNKITGNTTFSGAMDFSKAEVKIPSKLDSSSRGEPDGVAPLDGNKKLPEENLPVKVLLSGFDGMAEVENVQMLSAEAVKVIFNTATNRFVGLDAQGNYCNNWPGAKEYGTNTFDGIIPVKGKPYVHRETNIIYLWNGTELLPPAYNIKAVDPLSEWERPDVPAYRRLFIDMWNNLCSYYAYWGQQPKKIGQFNTNSQKFELGEVKDIDYEEALLIVYHAFTANRQIPIRVCLPYSSYPAGTFASDFAFYANNAIQTIYLTYESSKTYKITGKTFIASCANLVNIVGVLDFRNLSVSYSNMLNNCPKLEQVLIANLSIDFSGWKDSPLLNLVSVSYVVNNRLGTNSITITVHPDVYAKLIGDTTNEAAAALSDEEAAQWQALTVAAAEKNITFVTV